MPLDLSPLDNASRLLVEAELTVAPGTGGRFQPTGFPDLGPALYKGFDQPKSNDEKEAVLNTVDMLLVESVQSIGNHLEAVCLQGDDYNADCQGIPYVRVLDGHQNNTFLTSSVREPHRLASPYVLGAKQNGVVFRDVLKNELKANKGRPVHIWKMVPAIFARDPGCVLHGVFLEEIDGRIRLPRLVSGYIEASSPNQANSGGVYRGEVTAKDNVPYPRQEFTSPCIRASFILHLATLNSYNLDEERRRFLQSWALYKIDRFLRGYLRLRTACEFEVRKISTQLSGQTNGASNGFPWPESTEIRSDFVTRKDSCFPRQESGDEWQQRRVLVLTYRVDVSGQKELPEGVLKDQFNLSGFEGRAEIKEVSSGKKGTKKSVTKLVLTGDWPEDDQNALLQLNPEKTPDENEEEIENPAHAVVKAAIKDWNEKWKKEQKKVSGTEEPEE
ncbi:type I-U CRISPR-associated RAMP protein Csb1/Cas7u [Methylocaldum sp.]|uniref:type I-G CRISPR-associated RAMP protein Csb1/Cas7g n=1 Tax=Methylocaldum sp. TaxID=1969727 RepID=UPI00321FFD22